MVFLHDLLTLMWMYELHVFFHTTLNSFLSRSSVIKKGKRPTEVTQVVLSMPRARKKFSLGPFSTPTSDILGLEVPHGSAISSVPVAFAALAIVYRRLCTQTLHPFVIAHQNLLVPN